MAKRTRTGRLISICIVLGYGSLCHSQVSPKTDATPSSIRFDVVSIRLADRGSPVSFGMNEREFYATGPLSLLLHIAFYGGSQAPSAFAATLSKLPKWVNEEKYAITGTIPAEDLKPWEEVRRLARFDPGKPNTVLEQMLQSALVDRCHLIFHRTPDSVSEYALEIAMSGIVRRKMRKATSNDVIPNQAHSFFESMDGRVMVVYEEANDAEGEATLYRFYNTSMAEFAAFFPHSLGATVVDKTGLLGKYNFEVRFTQTGDADPTHEASVKPLGLRFTKVSVPIDGIVIDHIEKPSPN